MVVLVPALGIGANTAMVGTLASVVFDPLPYPGEGDLAWVWGRSHEGQPNTLSALDPESFRILILALFAATELLLVALGLCGVLGFSVNMRRKELGLRLPLGATRRDLVCCALGRGLLYALAGIALGIVGGLGVTQLMEGMLFGVSTLDPITFLLGPPTLLAVAFLACLRPALKTTATVPVESLNRD